MTFLTILGVTETLCSCRLEGKEIPESSRFEFLEMFSATNFVLSDAEAPLGSWIEEVSRFNLLLQMNKLISTNYYRSTSNWKPWRWVRLDLVLLMRDIYIKSSLNFLTKLTTSSRSTRLKDIFPWNISQRIMKTIPIYKLSQAIWWSRVSCFKFDGKSMELRQQHDQVFPMDKKPLQNKY